MKIGILTHPLETNYGGILQAFALQKVLRDMGHDVYTIDRHNRLSYPSFFRHFLSFGKRNLLHYLKGKNVSTAWNPFISEKDFKYISNNTQKFIDKNIQLTDRIDSHQLREIDDKYLFDAYVVGSDQVWLPQYCPDSFLSFVKRDNVKRVAYAASCGKMSFMQIEGLKQQCIELAKKFDAISAREEQLSIDAQNVLGKEVVHVLDPTMLLRKEDYLEVIEKSSSGEKELFSYVLDKTQFKKEVVNEISTMCKCHVINGNVEEYYVKKRNLDIEKCIFPTVDNWINGFNNAEYIITDSFHGTVFSIIFNKPFIVIGNKERGMGRFVSLLDMFGLKDRMVYSIEEAKETILRPIDYERVNSILSERRRLSMKFLSRLF